MLISFDCLEQEIEEVGFDKELPDDAGRLRVVWRENGKHVYFTLTPTQDLFDTDLLREVLNELLDEEQASQIVRIIERLCGPPAPKALVD